MKAIQRVIITAFLLTMLLLNIVSANPGDWEIFRQFPFDDMLQQMLVVNEQRGYVMTRTSLWETRGDLKSWQQKSHLPIREKKDSPGERLYYMPNRMAVWGDTIVLVGSYGTCFISFDAGATWEDKSDTTFAAIKFYWVQIQSPNHIWISGGTSKMGLVLRLMLNDPDSAYHHYESPDMDYQLSQVAFTDSLIGYAVAGGTRGDLFGTTDGGITWNVIRGNFNMGKSGRVYDLYFPDSLTGYACGYGGYLFKTSSGASQLWDALSTPETTNGRYLRALHVNSEQDIWCSGAEGSLYHTTDGGNSFQTYQLPLGTTAYSIWFDEDGSGLVATPTALFYAEPAAGIYEPVDGWTGNTNHCINLLYDSLLAVSGDDGVVGMSPIDDFPYPVMVVDSIRVNFYHVKSQYDWTYVLGYKYVLRSNQHYDQWEVVLSEKDAFKKRASDIAFVSRDVGYIVDNGGDIWKTTDGGQSWEKAHDLGKSFRRIHFFTPEHGVILDESAGMLWRTLDGGGSWQADTSLTEKKLLLHDLCPDGDSTLFVAGKEDANDTAIILVSHDYGHTWSQPDLPVVDADLNSIEIRDSIGVAAGKDATVLVSTDGGASWREDRTPIDDWGEARSDIVFTDGIFVQDYYYLVGSLGIVLRIPVSDISAGVAVADGIVRSRHAQLYQNYPNPFNPATIISYRLNRPTRVQLAIYNAVGQLVEQIIDEQQTAGTHYLEWQADGLPSGLYLYRLVTADEQIVRKMLLVK